MAATTNRNIKITWTGGAPCLCSGEWIFEFDGTTINLEEAKRKGFDDEALEEAFEMPLDTEGEFSFWYWPEGDDMIPEWETRKEGMPFFEWYHSPKKSLLEKIFEAFGVSLSPAEWARFYELAKEEDWRHGTCGGCI